MSGVDSLLGTYDEVQVNFMKEECILVDKQDQIIGHASKYECHKADSIKDGMLHRAFSVFLFNSEGKLMLQQRADEKITFPSRWTNTCCSHPLYFKEEMVETNAEGVKRAAVRKLKHELGIDEIRMEDLHFLTKIHYLAMSDDQWGEHEVDWILFAKKDVKFNLNANEVKDVQFVDMEELKEMVANSTATDQKKTFITPWFNLISENMLLPWWKNLDEIIKNGGLTDELKGNVKDVNYLE